MKYKVGDKVKVGEWADMEKEFGLDGDGDIRIKPCFAKGMKKYCGQILTISTIDGRTYQMEGNGWYWTDKMVEPVDIRKIVITADGSETIATLYDDGKVIKTATAKCSPDDTFDFGTGAKLAFERLMAFEGEWRVVNRRVRKGDYVRIIKPCFSFNKFGDILKVHSLIGDGINVKACDHPRATGHGDNYEWTYCNFHFEVVEPVKQETKFKAEHKFKIGDTVKVVNRGKCFTTYEDWFDKNAPELKKKWEDDPRIENGEVGVVKVVAPHDTIPHYGMLYAIELADERICLISEKGIDKVAFKVGDRVIVEASNIEDVSRYAGLVGVIKKIGGTEFPYLVDCSESDKGCVWCTVSGYAPVEKEAFKFEVGKQYQRTNYNGNLVIEITEQYKTGGENCYKYKVVEGVDKGALDFAEDSMFGKELKPYVKKEAKRIGRNIKFNDGDYAKITKSLHGHKFPVGTIVKLEKGSIDYKACANGDYWYVNDDELSPVSRLVMGTEHYGFIGEKTNYKDACGRPLFVGDVVEKFNKDGKSYGDCFIVKSAITYRDGKEKVFAMGIESSCDENEGTTTDGWSILKKRSFEEVANGERIDGIKCVKESD